MMKLIKAAMIATDDIEDDSNNDDNTNKGNIYSPYHFNQGNFHIKTIFNFAKFTYLFTKFSAYR